MEIHAASDASAQPRRQSWLRRLSAGSLQRLERLIGPSLSSQRERAMYGERQVAINIAEYDALRHQVPNCTMMLKPIAYPDVLGFSGFFISIWIIGAWLADWYGEQASPAILAPMLLIASLSQLLAAFRGIRCWFKCIA